MDGIPQYIYCIRRVSSRDVQVWCAWLAIYIYICIQAHIPLVVDVRVHTLHIVVYWAEGGYSETFAQHYARNTILIIQIKHNLHVWSKPEPKCIYIWIFTECKRYIYTLPSYNIQSLCARESLIICRRQIRPYPQRGAIPPRTRHEDTKTVYSNSKRPDNRIWYMVAATHLRALAFVKPRIKH